MRAEKMIEDDDSSRNCGLGDVSPLQPSHAHVALFLEHDERAQRTASISRLSKTEILFADFVLKCYMDGTGKGRQARLRVRLVLDRDILSCCLRQGLVIYSR